MISNRLDRRTFTATAAGFAVGAFATPLTSVSAQEGATPVATVPQGYVSMRVRTMGTAEGRVAVNEILLGNRAVSAIIREGKIESLTSVLQSGRKEGMQMMDDQLETLVKSGTIDGMDAYMKAAQKNRFEKYVEETAPA